MLCYKDKTFCEFYKECKKNKDCGKALIEKVQKEADDIGLSICRFEDRPNCFESNLTYEEYIEEYMTGGGHPDELITEELFNKIYKIKIINKI